MLYLQNFLDRAEGKRSLMLRVFAFAAVGAPLITNDGIVILLTPIVVRITVKRRLHPMPYLMTLATTCNIASVATQTGNPQNVLVGSLASTSQGVTWNEHLALSLMPAAVLSLLNLGLLYIYYIRLPSAAEGAPSLLLEGEEEEDAMMHLPQTTVFDTTAVSNIAWIGVVFAGMVVGFIARVDEGWMTLFGGIFMIVGRTLLYMDGKWVTEVIRSVDYGLLIFFSGLFVCVVGLNETGLPEVLWGAAKPYIVGQGLSGMAGLYAFMVVMSNLFSNVPVVFLLGNFITRTVTWVFVAMACTIAGNLTLVGSAANVIVAIGARQLGYNFGFFDHLRFGFASTIIVSCAAIPVYVLNALLLGYSIAFWDTQ